MYRLALVAALLFALVIPVAASAGNVPTTGARLPFFNPPSTYPADTAFHVEQGFACYLSADAANCANASTSFVLHVDGVLEPSQKDVDHISVGGTPALFVRYLTNFRNGLPAGTHTLTGDFYFNGALVEEDTIVVVFT